ncbi:alpha/beta hydrolase [Agromyces sp. S2-1-8]|jgi:acetyl esterase/lipase|uniref:alpha/beta hydrolase n=1 Tax=unclassified Agromyces TaxID=2639701 RepID=UPI001E5B9FDF|nr:alpha/beta hydrolase [Agromyces sp. S2-1-8]MCD5347557.1 alpha/beta hydrolase [Agromyces sp. S2-1-8]
MSRFEFDRLSADYAASRFAADATVAEMRTAFAAGAVPPPPGFAARDTVLGGRPAIELVPGDGGAGALLYLHGGGYVIGSAATGVGMAAALAERAGTTAYSLDYRLAPEHRFPAPVDDALAAFRELVDRVGGRRLVVAGDSAGGGLAVATLVAARDAGLEMPAAVAVFSPWADLTLSGDSFTDRVGDDPLFSQADIRGYADRYLPEGGAAEVAASPLASPVFASLRGLPPMLVQVGTRELLLDDAVRLAANAAHDDVEVVLEAAARAPHNYQTSLDALEASTAALDRAGAFLGRHLGAGIGRAELVS